jgi:hypothetical protein
VATCAQCNRDLPDVARYCFACGTDRHGQGKNRTDSYAVQPGETVRSLNVITSIMPQANGTMPQTYRFTLLLVIALPIVLTLAGFVSLALVMASVSMPCLYMFYFRDVNEWEDQPALTFVATTLVSIITGVLFTRIWMTWQVASDRASSATGSYDALQLLRYALPVAIGAVVLAQVGPVLLARQDDYDDLIDAMTFGIASGATFAAVESLSVFWSLVSTGAWRQDDVDTLYWTTQVVVAGILKPLVVGSLIGICLAAFAGIGEGPGRFSPQHTRTTVAAVVGLFVYLAVNDVIAQVTDGVTQTVSSVLWSAVVAAYLLTRVRMTLHTALIEAATEAAARDHIPKGSNRGIGFCPACRMPLLDGANFCTACGTATRAATKSARRDMATEGRAS